VQGRLDALTEAVRHRAFDEATRVAPSHNEVCRKHGISEPAFYAWKAKFGGMSAKGWVDSRHSQGHE
jgi:hypothetical protein